VLKKLRLDAPCQVPGDQGVASEDKLEAAGSLFKKLKASKGEELLAPFRYWFALARELLFSRD
jgi:hypothetical protein